MSKSNHLFKYLNNINKSINSLLEKNLNKLKFNNLIYLAKNNKIILTFVAVFIIFTSYLLIPSFYNNDDISRKLKKDLINKFDTNFNFTKKLKYNFFPIPHFKTKNATIIYNNETISKIESMKIYVSLDNLYSLKNLNIKNVILENANFNLNSKNYNFFTNILNHNFVDSKFKIKNSNIFFRSNDNEVLFINKIANMKYFYDVNELRNVLYSNNEIFNIPYSVQINNDLNNQKFNTKLNINSLRLQLENEHDYANEIKTGNAQLNLNNTKSVFNYKTNKKFFNFDYLEKLENPNFNYQGNLNLKPFYSTLEGETNELNLSYIFNSNSLFKKIIKTEILNSKKIEFNSKIAGNKIKNYNNFTNLILRLKIKEGIIDFDNTSFKWENRADFQIIDSLIFVKNGELILDGKLRINIKNIDKIYKYLLTPKKYRKGINTIDLNFTYNYDLKTIDLKDIKINTKFSKSINEILNNVILKSDKLQNKIYLKNLLNEAIKTYAG